MTTLARFQPGTPEWLMFQGCRPKVNLITSGEFEVDTSGWTVNGSTVAARSADVAYGGAYSCKLTVNDAGPSFFPMFYNITLPGAGTYRFSMALWLPTAYTGTLIRLTDNGQFAGATDTFPQGANMGLRDQWQVLTATCTPAADFAGLFGILDTNASGDGTFFYVDSCKIVKIV